MMPNVLSGHEPRIDAGSGSRYTPSSSAAPTLSIGYTGAITHTAVGMATTLARAVPGAPGIQSGVGVSEGIYMTLAGDFGFYTRIDAIVAVGAQASELN